jgi:hypothetical protein
MGSHFRHLHRSPSLAEFNCGDDRFCRFGASSFESHRNCNFKLAVPSENPSSPKLGGRWSRHLPWDHISGTCIGRPPWQNSIAETTVLLFGASNFLKPPKLHFQVGNSKRKSKFFKAWESLVNASSMGSHFRHLDWLPSLAKFNCGDDGFCHLGASSFESHRNPSSPTSHLGCCKPDDEKSSNFPPPNQTNQKESGGKVIHLS